MSTPVPFTDPPWVNGLPSPYYNESHRKWQQVCRAFMEEHLFSRVSAWDDNVQDEVYQVFMKHNMLLPAIGAPLPVDALKNIGITHLEGGLRVEDFDYMHCIIYASELVRGGITGPPNAIYVGFAYGLPALLKYGSRQLQDRVLKDLFVGTKRICLAITEPDAGSDVANITTEAKKSSDGNYYIVDGAKKWITNGIYSDYATMLVRTGGSGPTGLSMLLVPLKGHKGVNMRKLKVMGGTTGGTTFIELDEVRVPVENLIGEEGQGMRYTMNNFNHERLLVGIQTLTQARAALSLALAYVLKRQAFGQPLYDQPVVRDRIAKCGTDLEATWTWVESLAYQMTILPKAKADRELGGLTAAAKAKAGLVLHDCAECAVLLHGGIGLTDEGQGEAITAIWREAPGARIPGGSEDVLFQLMVRELVKNWRAKNKQGSKL